MKKITFSLEVSDAEINTAFSDFENIFETEQTSQQKLEFLSEKARELISKQIGRKIVLDQLADARAQYEAAEQMGYETLKDRINVTVE